MVYDEHARKQEVLEDYLGRYAKGKARDNQTRMMAILDAIEMTLNRLVPYGIPFWPGQEIVDRVAAGLAAPPAPTLPTQARKYPYI